MAITKITNIKQDKDRGSSHLKNSIHYIMNPKKTEDGSLIGGNAGSTPKEAFDTMMQTKYLWGKEGGRQGYHIVISFLPGDATKEQAYQVIGEFCKEYLGDAYDYVYSVHTDQNHMHGHIIFNSVNGISGYKYRYVKGDWEKYMQPVTDKICEKYGLPKLVYDKEKKEGQHYSEHKAEKEGRPTWTNIIKADIDYVIGKSSSFEDFLSKMQQMGYRIRQGKHMTFYPPGGEKGRRDSTLGDGYLATDIEERIQNHLQHPSDPLPQTRILSEEIQHQYDSFYLEKMRWALPAYQMTKLMVFYRAGHYMDSQNPYIVNQSKVRQDAIKIDQLYKECRFIIENQIESADDLQGKLDLVLEKEKSLRKENRQLKNSKDDVNNFSHIMQNKEELKRLRKNRKMLERLVEEAKSIKKQELMYEPSQGVKY